MFEYELKELKLVKIFGLNIGPPLWIGFPNLPKPHCLGQDQKSAK